MPRFSRMRPNIAFLQLYEYSHTGVECCEFREQHGALYSAAIRKVKLFTIELLYTAERTVRKYILAATTGKKHCESVHYHTNGRCNSRIYRNR